MSIQADTDNAGDEHGDQPKLDSADLFSSAMELASRGWHPQPLGGANGKKLLATGITGYSRKDATAEDIRFWSAMFGTRWRSNGVRCPKTVLGIDVDDYISRGKTKRGLATIAEHEARFGEKLPATYITTARPGGSGIRWFRIPHDWRGPGALKAADELPAGTEAGVELIQRTHRYAVVPPSIHCEIGEPYRLYGPSGQEIADGLLPHPETLPELPLGWLDGLAALCPARAVVGRRFNREEIELWLDAFTGNDYPHGLPQVVKKFHAGIDGGSTDRHKAMLSALCWALKESRVGGYPAREAEQRLRVEWLAKIAGDSNHDEPEFDDMLADAVGYAEADDHVARWQRMCRNYGEDTRDYAELVAGFRSRTESGDRSAPAMPANTADQLDTDVAEFWSSSAVLRDLRQFAQSRRVGPAAMLGNSLARVVAAIPPNVVLPPTIGSYAGLNLFVALVGRSGESKSASMGASADWLTVDPSYSPAKPGSGEGLAKCYASVRKMPATPGAAASFVQIGKAWSVLAQLPEVDTLIATGGRGGSTIMSELRSAWSGERLGLDYSGEDKRIVLCANRYRLCLVLGVQPLRAAPLFDDADGGTPQRFVWFPARDTDAPIVRPDEPPRLELPRWPELRGNGLADPDVALASQLAMAADPSEYRVLDIPTAAREAIDANQLAVLRGDPNADPLDGHRLLVRLKVSAALMALECRYEEISDADWERAGVLMALSDHTRQLVRNELSAKATAANVFRGRAEGERADVADQIKADRAVARIAENIAKKLTEAGGSMARSDARSKIAHRDRVHFDDAEALLLDSGQIAKSAAESASGSDGFVLALAESSKP